MPVLQIIGHHPVGRIALYIDLFDASAVDEVVDVGSAESRAQVVADCGQGQAHGGGQSVVNGDLELGRIIETVGAYIPAAGLLAKPCPAFVRAPA